MTELDFQINEADTREALKFYKFAEFAQGLATLSTCERLKVGAIAVAYDFSQVYAIGYNGQPAGIDHECDGKPGTCGCVHAEMNVALKMRQPETCALICTHLPCQLCAGLIINSKKITGVFYQQPYRITTSLSMFESVEIPVCEWRNVDDLLQKWREASSIRI